MIWMVNDKPIEECKDYIDLACEDAISKKEVFSILTRLMTEAGKDGKLILSDAKEMIGELPSVAPLRQVGEWIKLEVCNCHATLKCSVCDRTIKPTFNYGEYSYEDIKEWYPFCHCGADMRGDAE